MLLDDGIVRIYEVTTERILGRAEPRPRLMCRAYYKELGIGTQEWNQESQRGREPIGRIRIWGDRRVVSGNLLAFPDGRQCEAGRVYNGWEGDKTPSRDIGRNRGSPITEITMHKPSRRFELEDAEAQGTDEGTGG